MTQEDRKLLLVDICARLPYGVKCYEANVEYTFDIIGTTTNNKEFVFSDGYERKLEQIKPFLRQMSSMTEEEKNDYLNTFKKSIIGTDEEDYRVWTVDSIDWLNEHHFDYRGLIEKGLALEAPEDLYNIQEKHKI